MSDSTRAQPVEILLAEDNPGDVKLTEKALEQGQVLTSTTCTSSTTARRRSSS
jgi:CheY-like chemotaxis protein